MKRLFPTPYFSGQYPFFKALDDDKIIRRCRESELFSFMGFDLSFSPLFQFQHSTLPFYFIFFIDPTLPFFALVITRKTEKMRTLLQEKSSKKYLCRALAATRTRTQERRKNVYHGRKKEIGQNCTTLPY